MRLIVVAGMHRSGTSLLARVLNILGADLGPSSSLLAAAPDNPLGYWEHRDINDLNERLLVTLGGTWDAPPPLPDGWENSRDLDPLRSLAVTVVSEFSDSRVVCWKDPRFSLTLPFWKTVTRVDKVVLCLRSPGDVARSLAARDGLADERSADLWLRYTLGAWSGNPDRLTVEYEGALTDPPVLARRLAEQVELPSPTDTQLEAISSFVTPSLNHHAGTARVSARMTLAEHVYDLMTEPRTAHNTAVLGELARPWYVCPPGDAAGQDELSERLHDATAEAERREKELEQRNTHITLLTNSAPSALAENRRASLEALERRLGEAERELARREIRERDLGARLRELAAQLIDAEAAGAQLMRAEEEREIARGRSAEAERKAAELVEERGRLESEIHDLRTQLHTTLTSKSWRLTAPLRAVVRALRGGTGGA